MVPGSSVSETSQIANAPVAHAGIAHAETFDLQPARGARGLRRLRDAAVHLQCAPST